MTNLELAREKLEAARLILGAIDNYLETCARLQVEVRKLSNEADQLLSNNPPWNHPLCPRQPQPTTN
jgi:hypothetical protein